MTNKSLEELQKVIEYKFNNLEVLITALTHKSYASDAGSKNYNERMEFLGDSVLSAVVVEALYNKFPDDPEGKLSQYKSQTVSAANLSCWAQSIGLGDFIFLGKSEDSPQARRRESLLCDTFEAVVGALYLDGGLDAARKFVLNFFDFNLMPEAAETDYKSRLQEAVQSECGKLPEYVILKEFGPDHNKEFEAGVYVKDKLLGKGTGHTKKEAQQFAAKEAIKNIKK